MNNLGYNFLCKPNCFCLIRVEKRSERKKEKRRRVEASLALVENYFLLILVLVFSIVNFASLPFSSFLILSQLLALLFIIDYLILYLVPSSLFAVMSQREAEFMPLQAFISLRTLCKHFIFRLQLLIPFLSRFALSLSSLSFVFSSRLFQIHANLLQTIVIAP